MIETLTGTSAGSATVLKTMNLPKRSIFASSEIFIGGFAGISPSACHSPISRSNFFIVRLLSARTAISAAPEMSGDSAEGVGFEPTESLHPQRFSRPPHSTALPPHRGNDDGPLSHIECRADNSF